MIPPINIERDEGLNVINDHKVLNRVIISRYY